MHFVAAHPVWFTLGAYWTISAILNALPPLKPEAGFWAQWGHGVLQLLAANFNKIKPPLA